MAHHELTMPVTEAQVRALRVDDTVTLQHRLFLSLIHISEPTRPY